MVPPLPQLVMLLAAHATCKGERKTMRGKGTKVMAVADRASLPIDINSPLRALRRLRSTAAIASGAKPGRMQAAPLQAALESGAPVCLAGPQ